MDEAQIAAQVALNVPKEAPEPTSQPSTVQPDTPTDTGYIDDMPFDELTKYKLCEQFNIPTHLQADPGITDKLAKIYAWAATVTGSQDYLALTAFMHNIEGMMGHGGTQSRLDKFVHYAQLDMQRRKIEVEMQYA